MKYPSMAVCQAQVFSSTASLSRRGMLSAAVGGLATGSLWAAETPAMLPGSQALDRELAQALQKGEPLVVMVSLSGCHFCKVARESYLAPLLREQAVPIVQIDMRTPKPVLAFDGSSQTHDALARGWGIKVAPTVLFFGPSGKEVAERLVGAYLPDFYGAYLDERIRTARAQLPARKG